MLPEEIHLGLDGAFEVIAKIDVKMPDRIGLDLGLQAATEFESGEDGGYGILLANLQE